MKKKNEGCQEIIRVVLTADEEKALSDYQHLQKVTFRNLHFNFLWLLELVIRSEYVIFQTVGCTFARDLEKIKERR